MSDRDQWPDNPNDRPPPVPYRGEQQNSGGGCLKVALIVGGLGAVVLLVCCGVGGWFIWKFMPTVVSTPAEVAEVGQKAMKIDIPAEFVGETGVTMDTPFFAMRFANFRHKEGKGTLLIGSMQIKVGDLKDQKKAFNAEAGKQTDDEHELEIKKTEDREFTIRGQKVPFKFSEADEVGTGKKFRLVTSEVETAGSILIFKLILEEEAYDEEAVVKMIESIQ